jgi:hypothetical protein
MRVLFSWILQSPGHILIGLRAAGTVSFVIGFNLWAVLQDRHPSLWRCDKCNKRSKKLEICWGTSGTQKVDIIDYFCPHCSSPNLTFLGTQKELDAYWRKEWETG